MSTRVKRWKWVVTTLGRVVGVYRAITTGTIWLSAGLMAAMCLTILYATFSRYFFNRPQMWTEELNSIFLLTAVVLPLAYCLRNDIHVRVKLVVSRLSSRPGAIVGIVAAVLGLCFACLLVWKGWGIAWISLVKGYHDDPPPGYPLFPSQVMVPIGAFILVIAFVERIVQLARSIHKETRRNPEVAHTDK